MGFKAVTYIPPQQTPLEQASITHRSCELNRRYPSRVLPQILVSIKAQFKPKQSIFITTVCPLQNKPLQLHSPAERRTKKAEKASSWCTELNAENLHIQDNERKPICHAKKKPQLCRRHNYTCFLVMAGRISAL